MQIAGWCEESCIAARRSLPRAVVAAFLSVLLGACTWDSFISRNDTQPVIEIKAGDRWNTPFDRMGVVPVLPPSEDVQVGDIFVYPFNPDLQMRTGESPRRAEISISPRWDSLNLLQELDAEYRLRPEWPAIDDAHGQNALATGQQDSAAQDGGLFSGDRVPRRLRGFGVPEFNTFILSDEQANAVVPSEAINLVFGSAWNDNKAIAIRINSAETYSLGLNKILGAALDQSGAETVIREPYRNQLSLIADPAAEKVWVRILSDVVYVRSIDIIIQSRAGFEEDDPARADEFIAEIEETVTVTREAPAAEESSGGKPEADQDAGAAGTDADEESMRTETVTEVAPDHLLDPAYAAFVRANAINEVLIENHADDLSDSTLRFISVTDDSVTVRRTWPHGLAVGARGLTLEVDAVTGNVLRSSYMGTLIP